MRIIFFLVITISLQSCFNYVNLMEAESLGKGNNSIQIEGEADIVPTADAIGGWGSVELLYSRGITNNYDAGLYLNTNSAIGLYNKYQISNQETTQISIGLDAKILLLSDGNAWEVLPTFYYTKQLNSVKLIVNPAVKIATDFSAIQQRVYVSPTITTGIQLKNIPLSLGYTLSYVPLDFNNIFHGIGVSYLLKF